MDDSPLRTGRSPCIFNFIGFARSLADEEAVSLVMFFELKDKFRCQCAKPETPQSLQFVGEHEVNALTRSPRTE